METIPIGYKQTKVGVIPEDWDIVIFDRLKDTTVSHSITGGPFGSNLKSEHYTKEGVRIIQLQNIGDGVFINNDFIYTSEEKATELKTCLIYPDDIILAKMAEPVARACLIPRIENKFLMGSDGIRLHVDKTKYNNKFILESINYERFRKIAIARSTGSTRQRIGLSDLKTIPIAIPPLKEQQKIAKILTTWDNAISKQDELIKDKEELKKGLMQKLLNAEVRFSGFSNEWEQKKTSYFMLERNIKTPKSKEYPLMAFVAYKGVTNKGDRYNREFLVNDENNKKYKQTEYGDFIYSSNNLETGSIGLNRYGSATISPVYSVFKITGSCDYNFINSLLLTKSFINKMIRYRQGVVYGQWRIHESDFLKIKVRLPHLDEQQKIAKVLTNADKEIDILKSELEELKKQKKGLMQKLLTGKVRVKV